MLESVLVRKLIKLALEEDINFGDLTSTLTISEEATAKAQIVAREDLVACGLDLVPMIFQEMGAMAETEAQVADGTAVKSGQVLVTVDGNARDLLSAERTILNFLQRCSGVATYTRKVVEQAGKIVILDTRKTMPGWRTLDKYAVSTGGARNHRMNLSDMIMVKNNHIDAAEGASITEKIQNCLKAIYAKKPYFCPVEVEVRNREELLAAMEFKPDVVMLDNMSHEEILNCLGMIARGAPEVKVEISGGITPEKLKLLQGAGVKCASVGALTTVARNVDISMRISHV